MKEGLEQDKTKRLYERGRWWREGRREGRIEEKKEGRKDKENARKGGAMDDGRKRKD